MNNNPYSGFKGTHFNIWIKLIADPHEKFRGFSIAGRELKVVGYDPVESEMIDLKGNKMPGKFWVVSADEVYRVIPEMKRFTIQMQSWFFPVEFCEQFIRPDYYEAGKIIETTLK